RARCPFTLNSSAWLSVVPRKFVPAVVPALPPVFQKPDESSPSSWSAFRFVTLAEELTLSGGTVLPVTIDCRPGPPAKLRPVTPAELGSVEAVWPHTPDSEPVLPV